MKKLGSILCLLLSVGALAEEWGVYRDMSAPQALQNMSLTISPFQLFSLSLDGKYSLKLNNRLALTVPFVLQRFDEDSILKAHLTYLSLGAGARYYFSGNGVFQSGFYTEAALALGYSEVTDRYKESIGTWFARPYFLGGYSLALDTGWQFNFGLGFQYNQAFHPKSKDWARAVAALTNGPVNQSLAEREAHAHRQAQGYMLIYQGMVSSWMPMGELSVSYAW